MIFSILAFIALIVSICIKERKKSLIVQSINCLFEAIYDFIIYAYTGAILSIINFIRTYCLWQSNMKLVRISGITTGILYGSYYIYYNSWFMVLGDFILLVIGIYALWNNDIRRKTKNEIYFEKMP